MKVVVLLLAVLFGGFWFVTEGDRQVRILPKVQGALFDLNKVWLPHRVVHSLVRRVVDFLEFFQAVLIPPQFLLLRHASTYMPSAGVFAATELGISEALREGPKTVHQLAQELKVNQEYLLRLLRALETIGVFSEEEEANNLGGGSSSSVWTQTPMSSLLDRKHPHSLAYAVLMLGSEQFQAYGHLSKALKEGRSAFEITFGQPMWDYNRQRPEKQEVFDRSMTDLSRFVNLAIAEDFDFSSFRTLVDVGGGHGELLSTIMNQHRGLKGVLFDQEVVIQEAQQQPRWKDSVLSSRIQFSSGNFLQPPLPTADAYIMKQIAHDWGDDELVSILENIRLAMGNNPNATVLIADRVLKKKASLVSTEAAGFVDLLMLSTFGDAHERYDEEFKSVLERAGFEFVDITPTRSSFSVVRGRNKRPVKAM